VKPLERLGEGRAPDGTRIALTRRDAEFMILADGLPLMTSGMHGSEDALATLGCRHVPPRAPHVVVGGLGMGFTLRAALDTLPKDATVTVAELIPAVVEWNRGPLGPLANHPLDDDRVRVELTDVGELLRNNPAAFDAVLLDVDTSPKALTLSANQWLYGEAGITATRRALRPGGVLAVWSAQEDTAYATRLRRAGFEVVVERVRARLKQGGSWHAIFLAHVPGR
jgi:spermidine synthase